jgi:hypothetical protein
VGISTVKALKIIGFTLAIGAAMMFHHWLRNQIRRSGVSGGSWRAIRRDERD